MANSVTRWRALPVLGLWLMLCLIAILGTPALAEPEQSAQGEIRMFAGLGHSHDVASVAFSPDGRFVLTGSWDKTAKLWDMATGTEIRTFTGHSKAVTSIAFSPNGRFVLTGSYDLTAKLWDVASGKIIRTFADHSSPVASVAFSPDGRFLLTGSEDHTAKLWDTASGKEVRTFTGHTSWVNSVAFSPDGHFVLTGSRDETAKLWDTATGTEIRTFNGLDDRVTSVAFSLDGRLVLTGSEDGLAKLWGVGTGNEIHTFDGHSDDLVNSVAFSPSGRYILTGSWGGTAKMWEIATAKEIHTFDGHSGDGVTGVAFSPNGRYVLTGSRDNTAKLWNVTSGKDILTFAGHSSTVNSVAYSPDGRLILTGSDQGGAKLWDVATGKIKKTFHGISRSIASVSFSPNGQLVIIRPFNNTASIFDVENDSETLLIKKDSNTKKDQIFLLLDSYPNAIFSPDALYILFGSLDGTAQLLETLSRTKVRSFTGHTGGVENVAFSPNGRFVLTGSRDKTAKLWDTANGKEIRTFSGHTRYVSSVAFSPDGYYVLTGSGDHTAKLWDTGTTTVIRTFTGHSSRVTSVAFSPDGRFVLTGSADNTSKLWNTATGKEIRTFTGHSGTVTSVAFNLDGATILTGSSDGTTRIWDTATGAERVQMISFDDGSWITITPEGFFNASSRAAAEHLNVVQGLDVYSIEQLYQALYRPDLVAEKLAGDPDGKVARAAAKMDLRKIIGSGLPPTTRIKSPSTGTSSLDETVIIEALAVDEGGGIGKVEWYVNGIAQRSRGAIPFTQVDEGTAITGEFALVPGQNKIELRVYNEAGLIHSLPAKITVTWNGTATTKPKLHVLVVGVDKYAETRLQLANTAGDARAMAEALKLSGQSLFSEVVVTQVIDGDATKEGLEAVFASLSETVNTQDVFVFFLAGHGKTIDGQFYFLPQDFSSGGENPIQRNGIGQGQWRDWFGQIRAMKSILIYDACESGSLLAEGAKTRGFDEAQRQTAIDKLMDATGRSVLTATTDTTPAIEGFRGHGVFTYALLEAFSKGDSDGDGAIELRELAAYVEDRTPVIAAAQFNMKQLPQSIIVNNFPLGAPVSVLADMSEVISKIATHVVIVPSGLTLHESANGAPLQQVLMIGTQVRILSTGDGWALIARNGKKLGYVEADKLAQLQ